MINRFLDNLIIMFLNVIVVIAMSNQKVSDILVAGILTGIIMVISIEIIRKNTVAIVATVFSMLLVWLSFNFAVLVPLIVYELISLSDSSFYLRHFYFRLSQKKISDPSLNKSEALNPRPTIINVALSVALIVFLLLRAIKISGPGETTVYLGLCFLAILLSIKSRYYEDEISYYRERFDEARTQKKRADRKNEKARHDAEEGIYMATLQERNRIAREIHDNVGHMLTRAIVQLEALKVINKDENTKPFLESVSDTINQAMLNIRRSVHELHDDSIDMSIMINDIVKDMPDRFVAECKTSIESATPAEIKNAILAIVKESVNNTIKYSNGDRVKVEIIEHASFWRVYIGDNGTNSKKDYTKMYREGGQDSGIGLENICERAKRLGGRASITADEKGFVVLVTIPKNDN